MDAFFAFLEPGDLTKLAADLLNHGVGAFADCTEQH